MMVSKGGSAWHSSSSQLTHSTFIDISGSRLSCWDPEKDAESGPDPVAASAGGKTCCDKLGGICIAAMLLSRSVKGCAAKLKISSDTSG